MYKLERYQTCNYGNIKMLTATAYKLCDHEVKQLNLYRALMASDGLPHITELST